MVNNTENSIITVTKPLLFDGVSGNWSSVAVLTLWIFVSLIMYLLVGNIATILLLGLQGAELQDMVSDLDIIVTEYGDSFLAGNAIGLAFGLGGIALLAARLDSSRPLRYLRVSKYKGNQLILSVLGYIFILPIVLGLGVLNEHLPLPDILRQMEEQQMELIEWLISGGGNFGLNLILVAATPALFEEVFFRGFVQRRAERGMGIVGGILFTAILFGIFHLRLTQVLPLAVLGGYFAYITWRTGSLWIPMALHFLNNGLMLAASEWGPKSLVDPEGIPWALVGVSALVFPVCIIFIHRSHGKKQLN